MGIEPAPSLRALGRSKRNVVCSGPTDVVALVSELFRPYSRSGCGDGQDGGTRLWPCRFDMVVRGIQCAASFEAGQGKPKDNPARTRRVQGSTFINRSPPAQARERLSDLMMPFQRAQAARGIDRPAITSAANELHLLRVSTASPYGRPVSNKAAKSRTAATSAPCTMIMPMHALVTIGGEPFIGYIRSRLSQSTACLAGPSNSHNAVNRFDWPDTLGRTRCR